MAIWQTGQFRNRAHLYAPAGMTEDVHGFQVPGGVGPYTLKHAGVNVYYHYTDNVNAVNGPVRGKEYTLLTIDAVMILPGQELGPDWVVQDVSLGPDGGHADTWGVLLKTQGVVKWVLDLGIIRHGHGEMRVFQIDDGSALGVPPV